MNDFEMTNLVSRLRTTIENIVDERLNRLPISLPAKVDARKKSTVSVTPILTFGTLPASRIDDVPLMKSPYFNEPVKAGDYGLLIPCSYFYQSIVTDNLEKVDKVIQTVTTGNYVFLPLARVGDNPSDGVDSEIWSKGKSRYCRVKDDRIELGGATGFFTEWTALNTAIQGFITTFNSHTHPAPGGATSAPTVLATLNLSSAKKDTVTV